MRFLYSFLLLSLWTTPLSAQSGVPWCERAGAASVQNAYALIDQGDAILNQLSDCSQVNLMGCEQALSYYQAAEQQIAQVFFDAKGEACTWCDINPIGDVASELAIRGDHFTQALQWDVDLRGVWNDYQTWRDAPYCSASSAPPVAAPPVLPGTAGCGFVQETPGYYLPDSQGPELQDVSPDQCRQICDANDWCRSFTVNTGARACQFHDKTGAEVALQDAFNAQISHYTCLGR